MSVYRVQESAAREAISTSTHTSSWVQRSGIPGAVVRAAEATSDITSGIAEVRIVDAELSMVEDIERFRAELKKARPASPIVSPRGATNMFVLRSKGPKLRELKHSSGSEAEFLAKSVYEQ